MSTRVQLCRKCGKECYGTYCRQCSRKSGTKVYSMIKNREKYKNGKFSTDE